jgi:RNA polymerase sigma-70 factor (ECF subfamily)
MSRDADRPAGSGGDDVQLVARMATGDRAAFAEIYDRHAPMLMSFAKKMLGSTDEAADLLHDVFLEAWEQASSYDAARATVRAWLIVRLRSRAIDRLTSARARRTVRLESPDARTKASTDAMGTPELLGVRHALGRVAPDVREVLELTYFFGLTASEIAARLDVPIGTVKSRRARGLQLLEQTLADGVIDGGG